MAKQKSNLYYRCEYIAFRIAETIVRIMPIETALAATRLLGLIWWFFDKRHRQVADDNLRLAFGDKMPQARRDQIIKDMYCHFAMMAAEVFKFSQVIRRDNWREHVEFQHSERLFDVLARGRGSVVATGHLGNFELISYFFNMTAPPMLALGRRLDNPYLNDFLWAKREQAGQRVISSKKGALKHMALALRHGDVVAFVADQDAGRRGVFVELFGKKASTYGSFAALAVMMKVAVVPGYACRVGHPMKYRIYVDQPIEPVDTGDRQRDIETIAGEFNRRLERYITEFPEQWLWTHRRWKTRPPEEIAANETQKPQAMSPIAAGAK